MVTTCIIITLLLLHVKPTVIGRIVTYELQSKSTSDVNCGKDLTSNDTCHIICSEQDVWSQNIYCRHAGECIIDCTAYFCLSETNIHASNSSHLTLISSGEWCVYQASIYLPNNGNATIIGATKDNGGTVLDKAHIYAGTTTNYISITCDNPSGKAHLWTCQELFVNASTANFLEIKVNEADLSDASIRCPVDSALSPSCVIDAFAAETTQNLIIYADNGMPQDVEFNSLSTAATNVYKNTRIICTDSSSTIDANGNTFVGTPCYITLAPSNRPTKQPNEVTIAPTDPPSKSITEIPTITTHSESGFPTTQPSKYPIDELTSAAPTRSSLITNNPTQQHHESTANASSRTQYVQMTTKTHSESNGINEALSFSSWMNVIIVILTTICCCVSFIWGYTMIKKYIYKKEAVIAQRPQPQPSPPIQNIPSVNVEPDDKKQRVRSLSHSSNESMYDHVEEAPTTTNTKRGE